MKKKFLLLITFNIAICQFITNTTNPVGIAGDLGQIGVPLYALHLTHINNDVKGRTQFYKSLITTSFSTHLLKAITKKRRPDNTNDKSFPSGHTSSAFQGATFIHKRYGLENAYLPYLISIFVGYSRVHVKKHDWEDVIAGAFLGGINSWLLSSNYDDKLKANLNINQIRLQFNF